MALFRPYLHYSCGQFWSILTILLLSSIPIAFSCADHNHGSYGKSVYRRQSGTNETGDSSDKRDWSYIDSFDWGRANPRYELCQTGTQQSPIALNRNQGLSSQHRPDFSGYPDNVTGSFYNWGHGPAFTIDYDPGNLATLPSMKFDNETVYLKGWHTHTPADHSVSGYRSKAEIHLVHLDQDGHERAVVAVRMEPGRASTKIFPNVPKFINFNDNSTISSLSWDSRAFLREVNYLDEYWTYKGSLTSPPCLEGIQWFLARTVIYTGVEQMRELLRVSTYSARAEQDVWMHEINA